MEIHSETIHSFHKHLLKPLVYAASLELVASKATMKSWVLFNEYNVQSWNKAPCAVNRVESRNRGPEGIGLGSLGDISFPFH